MNKKVADLSLNNAVELLPMMSEEELIMLEADIKANGIIEPLVVVGNEIVDGRHRFMIARRLKLEEVPVTEIETPKDITTYVLSLNLKRRHLTASQKALIVYENFCSTSATKLSSENCSTSATKLSKRGQGRISDQVATLAGVGSRTVVDIIFVAKEGTPEDIQAIRTGKEAAKKVAADIRKRLKVRDNSNVNSTTKATPMDAPRDNHSTTITEEEVVEALKGNLEKYADILIGLLPLTRDTYGELKLKLAAKDKKIALLENQLLEAHRTLIKIDQDNHDLVDKLNELGANIKPRQQTREEFIAAFKLKEMKDLKAFREYVAKEEAKSKLPKL